MYLSVCLSISLSFYLSVYLPENEAILWDAPQFSKLTAKAQQWLAMAVNPRYLLAGGSGDTKPRGKEGRAAHVAVHPGVLDASIWGYNGDGMRYIVMYDILHLYWLYLFTIQRQRERGEREREICIYIYVYIYIDWLNVSTVWYGLLRWWCLLISNWLMNHNWGVCCGIFEKRNLWPKKGTW